GAGGGGGGWGADPGQQDHPAQHYEGPKLVLLLGGERADPAIAGEPGLHQLVDVGAMLDEADGGGGIVEEPAEAAVVEVDDADVALVNQQVGEAEIGMDQAEPVR